MCRHTRTDLPQPLALPLSAIGLAVGDRPAATGGPAPAAAPRPTPSPGAPGGPTARSGTRRRPLWQLSASAHCPVVGVCLPLPALRRLVNKLRDSQADADDHALHRGAVAECRQRSRLSEALQKHLDQRHALALVRAAKAKTPEALATWWAEASAGHDLPGALWATLTHARCTPALEDQVLGQVHMLQHQVGMAARVELARFEALIDENAVLTRALAAAQDRSLRQAASHAERVDALEADLVRQRAQTAAAHTRIAQLEEQLATLEAAAPHLRERHALARELAEWRGAHQSLQRDLAAARDLAQRLRQRAEAAEPHAPAHPGGAARPLSAAGRTHLAPVPQATGAAAAPAAAPASAATRGLGARAVLCVGGRPASVPLYRLVVERTGGRFMHHDGGDEDNPARLDATLAAADLVICQTGCVSHGAYWRVKDHCKRTGKRCVFVETPSRAALERALAEAVDGR